MPLNRKKLEKFLQRNLLRDTEDNPICRLTLRHAMGGNKAATVCDIECGPHDSYIELASRIEEAANDDAEGLGGLQGYILATYFKATPDKISERFSFRLSVESEDDDALNHTEAPTTQGLTSQLMRHNEAQARVMSLGMAEVARQQNRMIERLADQNDKLMERHFDVLELYEKMMTAESQREIEKMKVTSEIVRTDQIIEKGMLLAPVIVNKFMGKKMLPEKATPGEEMIGSLLQSLDKEQVEKMMSILRPEQTIVVLEAMEMQRAREEAEKKEKEGKKP